MKKLLIICAAMLTAAPAIAQRQPLPPSNRIVEATAIRMTLAGERVTVQFRLTVGRNVAAASEELVVNPALHNGAAVRQLPPIIIRGKRAKMFAERHWLGNSRPRYTMDPIYVEVGKSVDYTTTFAYEPWMRGGELSFDGVSVRCRQPMEALMGLIAENILDAEPIVDARIVETPVPVQPVARPVARVEPQRQYQPQPAYNTGQRLEQQYTFVAPATDLGDLNKMERRYIDRTQQGSLSIFFRQGSGVVDPYYNDNRTRLVDLANAIGELQRSPDTRISRIVVAGYASPEGGNVVNVPLAWDRAVVVKKYLMNTLGLESRLIDIYSGGVDYTHLRKMVEHSDMWQKGRIIEIIDNTPVWDAHAKVGVLGELMRLDGGTAYRRMYRDFFPQLRQAAMVKIYYETK